MTAEQLQRAYAERFGTAIPTQFARMVCDQANVAGICFLDAETVMGGWATWPGMFPHFHPMAEDGASIFGLYVPATGGGTPTAVLRYDQDECNLRPVAHDAAGFVGWAGLRLLFEGPDDETSAVDTDTAHWLAQLGVSLPAADACATQRQFDALVDLPAGGSACARLNGACRLHASGDQSGAEALAIRACQAAPWFVDAWYLAAQFARDQSDRTERLWHGLRCPAALSTRTDCYDLGANSASSHVLDACLVEATRLGPPASPLDDPLVDLVMSGQGLDHAARMAAAETYRVRNDLECAEREGLAAAAVATDSDQALAAGLWLAELYAAKGLAGQAAWCRRLVESD